MKYNVVTNGKVVKKNLSKKQAEDYCEKMNKEFMDSQEKVQKQKVKSGLPLRKSKYELYKVEVVKENVIRLSESDLVRIVKRVINENDHEEKDIFISKGFKGVRMELGGNTASPSTIIDLYNEVVEEGTPLVKYLGRDIFLNANDEEVDKYTVLDEINYAIMGGEEGEEDYM